jgi:hypothetical protein
MVWNPHDNFHFNKKLTIGGEDIFKPTIGNESLHEISNDNGVINFATSKNLTDNEVEGKEQYRVEISNSFGKL